MFALCGVGPTMGIGLFMRDYGLNPPNEFFTMRVIKPRPIDCGKIVPDSMQTLQIHNPPNQKLSLFFDMAECLCSMSSTFIWFSTKSSIDQVAYLLQHRTYLLTEMSIGLLDRAGKNLNFFRFLGFLFFYVFKDFLGFNVGLYAQSYAVGLPWTQEYDQEESYTRRLTHPLLC